MNKLFTKVAALSVGLAMAVGVGVGLGANSAKSVKAAETTVVYAQTSTSAASVSSGTAPTGSSVSFSTTYTDKNQLTSGKAQTWTFSDYSVTGTSRKITSIRAEMKRNSSKGTGTVSLTNNNVAVSVVKSSYARADLTSSYAYYDIVTSEFTVAGDVVLTLTSTENSIYLDAIEIKWDVVSGPSKTATTTTISPSSATLDVTADPEDTVQLSATVSHAGGDLTDPAITWTSATPAVATVSAGGLVTAKSEGTSVITASYAGDSTYEASSGTMTVTVANPYALSITPVTQASACTVNGKAGVKAGTQSNEGSLSITVPSGAKKLIVHAVAWNGAAGTVTLSGATVSPTTLTLTADSGISGNSPFTLAGTESSYLFEIALSNITTDTAITFTSGTAKRFVVWGASYSTEGSSIVAVTGVTLSQNSANLTVGGSTVTLTETVAPVDATDKTVTWSSSDTSVATVSDGVITAVDYGTATITVTTNDGGFTATCSISVALPSPIANKTVAEALTVINGLTDNETTSDYYKVTGYIVEITYAYSAASGDMSFKLADTRGGSPVLTCYRVKCTSAFAADATTGAKVAITGKLEKFVKNETTTPELVWNLKSQNEIIESGDTPTSALEDGDYFIVYYGTTGNEQYFTGVNANDVGTYSATKADALVMHAIEGATSGQFAFAFNNKYLSYSGSSNKIYTSDTNDSNATLWTATTGTYDTIESVNVPGRYFKFNTSSGQERFCCYTTATNIHIEIVAAPAVTYTVTYDANGGTGTMTDSNSPYNSGATVTVLANTFTRSGYTFDHWDTAMDDSGTDYVAGNTFNISANTTLYAQWVADSPTPSGGGTVTWTRSGTTDTVTSGYEMHLGTYTSKTGYYQDSNTGIEVGFKKATAMWTTTVPTTLSLTVTVGGGTAKDPLDNNVYAYFLDSNYDLIVASQTLVTDKTESTTGTEYEINMPSTTNVYGLAITHTKESSYNVRLFAISFTFGSDTPTSPIISGTFEYNSKESLYVGDAGYIKFRAPEGMYSVLVDTEDDIVYFDNDNIVYDSDRNATLYFMCDETATADVEITMMWFSQDEQTDETLTATIQLINPTGLADARSYAGDINACCGSGSEMAGLWEMLAEDWTSLSSEAKAFLLAATYTYDGTTVTKSDDTHNELALAMSRYDYMVETYGMTNFMNKPGLSQAVRINVLGNLGVAENNTILIIAIVSVLSIAGVGGYFFLRRRKEQ